MVIFVDMYGSSEIKVTGDTYPINKILGQAGLGFKFNKEKKEWRGKLSGKALNLLSEQSGAILTSKAIEELEAMQRSAEKKAAYMKAKAGKA